MSISANIAEDSGERRIRDFPRFIRVAGGSVNEVESLLQVAHKLGYLATERLDSINDELVSVRRQLAGLRTD